MAGAVRQAGLQPPVADALAALQHQLVGAGLQCDRASLRLLAEHERLPRQLPAVEPDAQPIVRPAHLEVGRRLRRRVDERRQVGAHPLRVARVVAVRQRVPRVQVDAPVAALESSPPHLAEAAGVARLDVADVDVVAPRAGVAGVVEQPQRPPVVEEALAPTHVGDHERRPPARRDHRALDGVVAEVLQVLRAQREQDAMPVAVRRVGRRVDDVEPGVATLLPDAGIGGRVEQREDVGLVDLGVGEQEQVVVGALPLHEVDRVAVAVLEPVPSGRRVLRVLRGVGAPVAHRLRRQQRHQGERSDARQPAADPAPAQPRQHVAGGLHAEPRQQREGRRADDTVGGARHLDLQRRGERIEQQPAEQQQAVAADDGTGEHAGGDEGGAGERQLAEAAHRVPHQRIAVLEQEARGQEGDVVPPVGPRQLQRLGGDGGDRRGPQTQQALRPMEPVEAHPRHADQHQRRQRPAPGAPRLRVDEGEPQQEQRREHLRRRVGIGAESEEQRGEMPAPLPAPPAEPHGAARRGHGGDEQERKADQLEGDAAEVQVPRLHRQEHRRRQAGGDAEELGPQPGHRERGEHAIERRRRPRAGFVQAEQRHGRHRRVDVHRVLEGGAKRPHEQRPAHPALVGPRREQRVGVVAVGGLVAVEAGGQIAQLPEAQAAGDDEHQRQRRERTAAPATRRRRGGHGAWHRIFCGSGGRRSGSLSRMGEGQGEGD